MDIGGRDRGKFIKPKAKVKNWIFADIIAAHNPDVILDITNMHEIKNKSIDVVNVIEVFEHVLQIEKGLKESHRVLKNGALLIFSIPFLYPIHADPTDYQRWTIQKWRHELDKLGFIIKEFELNGLFFTVLTDMIKTFFKSVPKIVRILCLIFFPILDLIKSLDNTSFVKNNKMLNKYHSGYFIVAEKSTCFERK